MDKYKFYAGQEIQSEELNGAIDSLISNLSKRSSFFIDYGILEAAELYKATENPLWNLYGKFDISQNGEVAYHIDVSSGVAIDKNQQLIHIPTDSTEEFNADKPNYVDALGNAIPKSTGHIKIPVVNGVMNYVYIQYLQQVDTATAQNGEPVDKYTIDPDTGVVNYTSFIDGYKIGVVQNVADIPLDALYLGSVDASDINLVIDMSNKTYAKVNAAFIKAKITDEAPATYENGQLISMDDHIKAIANIDYVSPNNPHGMSLNDIPGLIESIGPYSFHPQIFNTNGIVDLSDTTPGPLFGTATTVNKPNSSDTMPSVILTPIGSKQYVNIEGTSYIASHSVLSEVYDGVGLSYTKLEDEIRCDFSKDARAENGYFYICATHGIDEANVSALKITAIHTGETTKDDENILPNLIHNFKTILSNQGYSYRQYLLLGIVFFNHTAEQFEYLTDPDTGQGNIYVLDIRRFGTIGTDNLLFEKRLYPSDYSSHTNVAYINRNINLLNNTLKSKNITGTIITGNSVIANGRFYENTALLVPPGTIITFAGPVTPAGYLLCDGSAVSKTQYADLYNALINPSTGLCYYGETANEFYLPDLRGKFIRGYGSYDSARASAELGVTQEDAILNHRHRYIGYGTNDGGFPGRSGDGNTLDSWTTYTSDDGYRSADENRPINMAMLYCIKY